MSALPVIFVCVCVFFSRVIFRKFPAFHMLHFAFHIPYSITFHIPLLAFRSPHFTFHVPASHIPHFLLSHSTFHIPQSSLFLRINLDFWKLPTYPSPKSAFCPKREVSVNVGLGRGKPKLIHFFCKLIQHPAFRIPHS